MLFNSLDFILFFPIVTFAYFLIPVGAKHIWLLVSSYYFYMCWNAKYALLMLLSTAITYASGLLMEWVKSADYSEDKKIFRKKYHLYIVMQRQK